MLLFFDPKTYIVLFRDFDFSLVTLTFMSKLCLFRDSTVTVVINQ